jgi:hypothetical protein
MATAISKGGEEGLQATSAACPYSPNIRELLVVAGVDFVCAIFQQLVLVVITVRIASQGG